MGAVLLAGGGFDLRLPYDLRAVGSRLLGQVRVPILAGPNAGLWWSLVSSGRGYVTGRFERDRIRSTLSLVRPGDRVWDVGAHKGYLSLAAARRVGPTGQVVAFEPSRRNLGALHHHVRWSRLGHIEVVPVALGREAGQAWFGGRGSSLTYRLGRGDERVPVRTAAELVAWGREAPTVMKVDVEGAEADVLEGAGEELSRIGLIILAVHDLDAYHRCREILDRAGFQVVESRAMRHFTRDGAPWRGDADLAAFRPERGLVRADVEALPYYA
jgi:FkbM family methyltransferase